MNRLIRFSRLPAAERKALLEAVAALLSASLRVGRAPRRKIAPLLGRHRVISSQDESPTQAVMAERVRWAVATASRLLPWKPSCLPQAIAATRMLRRRGIGSTLYLGVASLAGLQAHAWVRAGRVIVAGGPHHDRFTIVSTFG